MPELTEVFSSKLPQITKTLKDSKQCEIESMKCGFFKVGIKADLQKEEYKEIGFMKYDMFQEVLEYLGYPYISCLSDLEVFDPQDYSKAVGEADEI